jgi:hypothetical protein
MLPLFVALNDEFFAIKQARTIPSCFPQSPYPNDSINHTLQAAMGAIGRLAIRNAAYVMPPLRKTLIELLTVIE